MMRKACISASAAVLCLALGLHPASAMNDIVSLNNTNLLGTGEPCTGWGSLPSPKNGPRCYEGSKQVSIFSYTTVIKINSYESGNGMVDLLGRGVVPITCSGKKFSVGWLDHVSIDLSDCLPKAAQLDSVVYCPDQDAFKVGGVLHTASYGDYPVTGYATYAECADYSLYIVGAFVVFGALVVYGKVKERRAVSAREPLLASEAQP